MLLGLFTLSREALQDSDGYYMAYFTLDPMEVAAIIGLVLFICSEIIPHTPLAGNGVVEVILNAGRKAFPKPEKPAD